jgi:hypothetical protein
MLLKILGVKKDAPELLVFRKEWKEATMRENLLIRVTKEKTESLSILQDFVIDLFCGFIEDPLPETLSSIGAAQIEFEALLRGRQIALASAFVRGQVTER